MIDPLDRDLSRKAHAHLTFTYTDGQRRQIRTVVRDRLGCDADERVQSLGGRIEAAASAHIRCNTLESQTPGQKARIKRLTAMRERAEALHADIVDALAPSFIIEGMGYRPMTWDADPLDQTKRAIATLVSVIDASLAARRSQPTADTREAGRDHFWNEMLAIWISIGGAETGIAAAEFLVATSKPVFDRVRAIGGHKTTASMPKDYEAVVEWLRLGAKASQACGQPYPQAVGRP